MRADVQRQAPRPRGFDSVQIKHLRAIERGEVTGLSDLFHQISQHSMAQAAQGAVVQRIERELAQGRADHEVVLVDVARQETGRHQLAADPVHGCLGQAQRMNKVGQRHGLAGMRQHGQYGQAACR